MMLYFAYGSNMSEKRLKIRLPSARKMGLGRLPEHSLRFHKVSQRDGSGKCDAYFTSAKDDEVIGVLFEISSPSDKRTLDSCEGLGHGYDEKIVEIQMFDGRGVQAFTYYATLIDSSLRPFHWYKEHVLRGAKENQFPNEYLANIENFVSEEDPDIDRSRRELSIYN